MAKGPFNPQQQAQAAILAEQQARQVADALEQLRRQLDPTREATQKLQSEMKEQQKAAREAAQQTKELNADLRAQYRQQQIQAKEARDAAMNAASEAARQKAARSAKESALAGSAGDETGYGSPAAMFQRFGGQLATGNIKGVLSEVAGSFGLIGQAGMAVVGVVTGIPSALKSAAASVQSLVAEFSPFTAGRYTQAWRDLNAVIGRQLMPVMNAATAVVRYFGDTIGGLTSVIRPLVDGGIALVKPIIAEIGRTLRQFITSGVILYETIRPVATIIFEIVNPLKTITYLMKIFNDGLQLVNRTLSVWLGIKAPNFDGSSQGAAFAGTGTTSTSSMLQSLREKSYQLGGGGKDVPQQQLDVTRMILRMLEKFSPEAIGTKIADEIKKAVQDAMQSLQKFAGDAVNMLPKAIAEATKGLPAEMAEAVKKAIADAAKALPFGGGGGGGGGLAVPGTPWTPPLRF